MFFESTVVCKARPVIWRPFSRRGYRHDTLEYLGCYLISDLNREL